MARRKSWEWIDKGNGYAEVKLLSWKYFTDFVYKEMLNYETYVWRGQRCDDWALESTLDRLVNKAKVAKTKRHGFVKSHLEQFQYAVRGRRGMHPPLIEDENEWWALGQHHGLATPLLDWTTSPFVAAYFAFIGEGEIQTRHRAIFALHRPTVERLVREKVKAKEEENKRDKEDKKPMNALAALLMDAPVRPDVEFIRPFSDENMRLVNQGGLFTRAPRDKPLDIWIQENPDGNVGYTLIKIILPDVDRAECLKMLNRMNINHLTLFPDLYGASKFCNLFGEIEKY
ncbi:MAG: FRG domain-containing protein [Nitrosomonadales bacterium]|nr:FRG domain-containing protein [Nitrosomonadales bacterium]